VKRQGQIRYGVNVTGVEEPKNATVGAPLLRQKRSGRIFFLENFGPEMAIRCVTTFDSMLDASLDIMHVGIFDTVLDILGRVHQQATSRPPTRHPEP
jgi:hypothetical protein